MARRLVVFLRTSQFKENYYFGQATMRLPLSTAHTGKLIAEAYNCLEQIFKPGYRYSKVGIMFVDLVPEGCQQEDLFLRDTRGIDTRLMHVMDRINRQWGSHTLRMAAEGIQQSWKMNRAKLSPRYTTQWSEIPVARC